jgi:hypothetical protein
MDAVGASVLRPYEEPVKRWAIAMTCWGGGLVPVHSSVSLNLVWDFHHASGDDSFAV